MRLIDANALEKEICKDCKLYEKCLGSPHKCGMIEVVYKQPTIEAEPVKRGQWNDHCNEVICSNCKAEFDYEMLIFIANGLESEYVCGMTCRCPKCGSYNRYGGADNG